MTGPTEIRPRSEMTIMLLLALGWIVLTILLFYLVPSVASFFRISPSASYAPTTVSMIYFTIAMWASTTVIGVSRGIAWLLAYYGVLDGGNGNRYFFAVKSFYTFAVWSLAISTALTAYLTQWFT